MEVLDSPPIIFMGSLGLCNIMSFETNSRNIREIFCSLLIFWMEGIITRLSGNVEEL